MKKVKWLGVAFAILVSLIATNTVQAAQEVNSVQVIDDEVGDDESLVEPWVKPTFFQLQYDYTLDLKVREQEKLYVTDIKPENANDQSIRWESSNDDVATVDMNGLVKAIMPGKATIKASFNDNPSVFRTAEVTVSGRKVSIDEREDPVLNIGDIKDLVLAGADDVKDSEIIWTSSNNKVVSIIYGGHTAAVKAVGKGTATITVRLSTGEEASIKVTVKAPVLAKTIKLNKSTATVRKGNKIKLKATVGDKNTTDKTVRWSSSNKKIATVDSKGTVTAKAKGTVTITAKTTNNKVAKVKIRVPYEKTLKAGDWTAGKSIPAGRYEITTTSNSGNLRIYRKGKRIVNVKIGTSTKGSTVKSYTTTLKAGDKIKVLSMQKAVFIKK